jgi:fructokinase
MEEMIGAIELGGTKTVVAHGTSKGVVMEEWRFPTTTPEETLQRAIAWLSARGKPTKIGVGAFGPIFLKNGPDFGRLLATPKPGWQGFSIHEALTQAFPEASVIIDTDVNAAALAEAQLGAAEGLRNVVYITIGTGIGGGMLADGRLIHGALHPEFGHLKVPRHPEDDFAGVCPFHGDCLEGLASGPAIAARWGLPAEQLPPDHPAWEIQSWYLAHSILSLLAILSPERVIIGGGVSQVPGFHAKVEAKVRSLSAGYFMLPADGEFVVPPRLGQQAGICGSLLLTDHVTGL